MNMEQLERQVADAAASLHGMTVCEQTRLRFMRLAKPLIVLLEPNPSISGVHMEHPYLQADTTFLTAVKAEVIRARTLFPSPNLLMAALTEEVGELAKACLDVRTGKGKAKPQDIYTEAVQVAAMACRLATEGDPSINPEVAACAS
jgi:hypothetical protein